MVEDAAGCCGKLQASRETSVTGVIRTPLLMRFPSERGRRSLGVEVAASPRILVGSSTPVDNVPSKTVTSVRKARNVALRKAIVLPE